VEPVSPTPLMSTCLWSMGSITISETRSRGGRVVLASLARVGSAVSEGDFDNVLTAIPITIGRCNGMRPLLFARFTSTRLLDECAGLCWGSVREGLGDMQMVRMREIV